MKQAYITKNFRQQSLAIIAAANSIIDEYQNEGFTLTLRQLYYQFVARDYLPNTDESYAKLGCVVNDGRLAGLIDWDAITDRTRFIRQLTRWESPAAIVRAAVRSYHIDRWEGQQFRPEVWVEKDALIDVIAQACEPLDVPHFSCRGYVSQSAMREAAERLIMYQEDFCAHPVILHLGDHDPSGIDMTRDITDRLELFGADCEVRRIALTMDQVEELNPPPNPAKVTDSRYESYVVEYGDESWELDALEPSMLVSLISQEIQNLIDYSQWALVEEREAQEREQLMRVGEGLG